MKQYLSDSSISGLYKDSYELESCSYSFSQGVDTNGKPQAEVRGGTIYLTYGGLPQDDMLRWMLGSTKYEDGAIVVCNDNNEPLEKVYFEQAACVGLEIEYAQKGKAYIPILVWVYRYSLLKQLLVLLVLLLLLPVAFFWEGLLLLCLHVRSMA